MASEVERRGAESLGQSRKRNRTLTPLTSKEMQIRDVVCEAYSTVSQLQKRLGLILNTIDGPSFQDKERRYRADARAIAAEILEDGVLWSKQKRVDRLRATEKLRSLYPNRSKSYARGRLSRYMAHRHRITGGQVFEPAGDDDAYSSGSMASSDDEGDDHKEDALQRGAKKRKC